MKPLRVTLVILMVVGAALAVALMIDDGLQSGDLAPLSVSLVAVLAFLALHLSQESTNRPE